MRQRSSASTRPTVGGSRDSRPAQLAALLPGGEPVESMLRKAQFFTPGTPSGDYRELHRRGGRSAEEFYRERWRHDREVRSTQGHTYSPSRVRYLYVRGPLLQVWREARARLGDRVLAWAEITGDPERTTRYKEARGKGGFVYSDWDEVSELIAAAHVHTIKAYGPCALGTDAALTMAMGHVILSEFFRDRQVPYFTFSYPLWYLWLPYVVSRSRVPAHPAETGTGGRKWRKIGVPY